MLWGVGTPEVCRDFRPSELSTQVGTPTLSNFEKHVTELKLVRCRNSRCMPELPTVGTPDLRRNSRPSRLLKTSRWPLVMHTGHIWYDQDSEPSKLFKLWVVETPDHCWNFRPSKLPTYVGTPDEPTREQHFYSCWVNTGHVRYEYRTRPVLPDQQK